MPAPAEYYVDTTMFGFYPVFLSASGRAMLHAAVAVTPEFIEAQRYDAKVAALKELIRNPISGTAYQNQFEDMLFLRDRHVVEKLAPVITAKLAELKAALESLPSGTASPGG